MVVARNPTLKVGNHIAVITFVRLFLILFIVSRRNHWRIEIAITEQHLRTYGDLLGLRCLKNLKMNCKYCHGEIGGKPYYAIWRGFDGQSIQRQIIYCCRKCYHNDFKNLKIEDNTIRRMSGE
jgi:hypothetical protein